MAVKKTPKTKAKDQTPAGDEGEAPEIDLAAKFSELEGTMKSLSAENKRLQDLAFQFMSMDRAAAPAAAEKTTPAALNFDFSDLPDPATKPEEFRKALGGKMGAVAEAAARAARDEINSQASTQGADEARINALWTKFRETHPDLADMDEIIKGQAEQSLAEVAGRGIDPKRYIIANPDGFIDDVAKRTRARMEKLGLKIKTDAEEESDDAEEGTTDASLADPSRAMAMLTDKHGGPGDKSKQKNTPVSTFEGELKETQRAMGIF